MSTAYEQELARIERETAAQAKYIEQNKVFVAEFEELCKRHARSFNAGANIIMFASLERGQGYSQEQLKAAFEMVQDDKHWKNPIDCYVYLTAEEVNCVREAVVHFTGGSAQIEPIKLSIRIKVRTRVFEAPRSLYRMYHVTAAGYYACVGA